MKMKNFKKSGFSVLLILLFKSGLIFSQHQANLVLAINDEIIAQNVKLEFINDGVICAVKFSFLNFKKITKPVNS